MELAVPSRNLLLAFCIGWLVPCVWIVPAQAQVPIESDPPAADAAFAVAGLPSPELPVPAVTRPASLPPPSTSVDWPRGQRTQRLAQSSEIRSPKHTSFLTWVHADALWVPASTGNDTLGLIGAHLTVANVGRMYFFGPPGVMLVRVPSADGTKYSPAFTWGFSFYLIDFHLPGSRHTAQLFINLTKVWTQGDVRMGMDMGGLSVSWKK
jgi:hypothetical protein